MNTLNLRLLHSLEKVLPDREPPADSLAGLTWSALRGERTAIQLAVELPWQEGEAIGFENPAVLTVTSELAGSLDLCQVRLVPSELPAYPWHDDNYLTAQPGLLPDWLQPVPAATPADAAAPARSWPIRLLAGRWLVFWLELIVPAAAEGSYAVACRVEMPDRASAVVRTYLQVIPASLPAQTLRHTEWFHGDCLADYYHVPVFSAELWRILANFIRIAADHGINMLLTPLFTPPLDTAVGGERTTIQLVGVTRDGGTWSFDWTLLKRWLDLASELGIRYFEMSHLFTQWGAKATPKIMATVDGRLQKVFGWDTPATGPAYREFLAAFLPELVRCLTDWGYAGQCYFHVSDEPSAEHLASYTAARDLIAPHIGSIPIIDALSDYAFYTTGAVRKPIPASNHIQPFLDGQVPGLWTYYCCGQGRDVSNRFMAMPSARNRILGVQLYKFQIEGFLQWGYNFYNSRHSVRHIDPFAVTDADCSFPSGDAFMVYPGPDGQPEASIRLKVFHQGLQDLGALQLLESLTSRETVLTLVEDSLPEPITFSRYPTGARWLLDLRSRVNQAIQDRLR